MLLVEYWEEIFLKYALMRCGNIEEDDEGDAAFVAFCGSPAVVACDDVGVPTFDVCSGLSLVVEIVAAGVATIVDTDFDKIIAGFEGFTNSDSFLFPPIFGDGNAAEFILNDVKKHL